MKSNNCKGKKKLIWGTRAAWKIKSNHGQAEQDQDRDKDENCCEGMEKSVWTTAAASTHTNTQGCIVLGIDMFILERKIKMVLKKEMAKKAR